jgi:hypothetical protein
MIGLMRRLLEASPSVLALLDSNPFADAPPKYVRAQLYDYRFADQSTHAATGQWWVRRLEGLYFPEVSLADFRRAADRPFSNPTRRAVSRVDVRCASGPQHSLVLSDRCDGTN